MLAVPAGLRRPPRAVRPRALTPSRGPVWQALAAAALLSAQSLSGEPQPAQGLDAAIDALRANQPGLAASIATEVLASPAGNRDRARWIRAVARERMGELHLALEDFAAVAEAQPENPRALVDLGSARFKVGDMEGAISALDTAVAAEPGIEAQLWQRGIAHYYAGRFREGARQFEIHRRVNPRDVENSAWHFLCVAKAEGLEQARAGLIPVQGDPRVPMAEVLRLFAGEARPEEVIGAAAAEGPGAMFYAHLYVGLYREATGDRQLAREHIAKAVESDLRGNYMWHVARVHQMMREGR